MQMTAALTLWMMVFGSPKRMEGGAEWQCVDVSSGDVSTEWRITKKKYLGSRQRCIATERFHSSPLTKNCPRLIGGDLLAHAHSLRPEKQCLTWALGTYLCHPGDDVVVVMERIMGPRNEELL
ncbi:hypothetical protein V8E52_006928 [Russula decolorans]